jgi:hypothetical protein
MKLINAEGQKKCGRETEHRKVNIRMIDGVMNCV